MEHPKERDRVSTKDGNGVVEMDWGEGTVTVRLDQGGILRSYNPGEAVKI